MRKFWSKITRKNRRSDKNSKKKDAKSSQKSNETEDESDTLIEEDRSKRMVASSGSSSSTPSMERRSQISKGFPTRASSSSCSSGSSSSPKHQIRSAEEVNSAVYSVTRYSFADLITAVLRLDFWDNEDPKSILFCRQAFDIVIKHTEMPERTMRTLKTHLEGETPLPDLATLIMTIKEDPVINEHSPMFLLTSLLLVFVQTGNYDCRYRVLLRHIGTLLAVLWDDFEEVENTLASSLLEEQYEETEEPQSINGQSRKAREKTARNKKIKRYLMIGAAGSVGGVLIGLTGGLAAPLVAAGAGVVIGTGAAAGIATTAGAAILGTSFGVAGAGLAGYKMKKRVGAIEEFSVEPLTEGTSLNCVLVVSGWIDKDTTPSEAFVHQWRHLILAKEQYTLHYESRYLVELGKAIEYLMSFAVSMAIQQTLMETALAGLLTAVAWPVAILSCASVLDNPWNVCIARAAEVGEHLADVLLSRSHGKRPISLIGFSLGARVIYHCLLAMSKRSDSVGIVEDVVLLGAPVSASPKQWKELSRVVGGRIINGYCETDWLLRFVYRTMSVQFTIAGTGPVDGANKKIVNYNLSHIVKGHMDYSKKLTEVLQAVGVPVSPHSSASAADLQIYETAIDPLDSGRESAGTEFNESDTECATPSPSQLSETFEEIKVRDHSFNQHDRSFNDLNEIKSKGAAP